MPSANCGNIKLNAVILKYFFERKQWNEDEICMLLAEKKKNSKRISKKEEEICVGENKYAERSVICVCTLAN